MALVKWYDDEEQKKENLFAPKQIASVQSTWQPTMQNGGSPAKPQSYLMSDEKAQADHQLAQRRAAEAQARAQAQAQAQAARQFAQAQQQQQKQQQQAVPTIKNPEQAQNDTGWKQFYNEEFNKAKKGQNFVQRLMDGGQASRRAELNARNRYTSSLLNRAYDDNGNILDANAAQSAHALAQYNSGVAANNAARTRAISNAIGATHENRDQNVFDRLKSTANAVRNMSLYDGVVGVNDETKFSLDDVGRFGGSLVQGIATAPILAGKSLTEAVRGRGTKADTGLEGELTGAERAGRTISGLLDAVTPFMAGSGQLVQSLATKVMANAATAAERRLLNRMLTAAAEESVLSGSQAGAEYFGQGGVLVDENGEIDVDKLAEFGKQVGMGAGMGAVGGAALSGAATGINRLGNRGNKLTPEPRPQPTDGNVTFEPANAPGSREITLSRPLPITDTYVPPRQPTQPAGPTIPERPLTPEPQQMTPEPQTPKTPEQTAIDEVRQREQAQREQPAVEQTPVLDESVQPIPEVADGVVNPQPVLPDMPETRSEQVRALQEARAGKTQAEEAVINKQVQQLTDETPRTREEIDAERQRQALDDAISGRENAAGRMMAEDGRSNLPEAQATPKYMRDKVTAEGYFTENRYKDTAYPKNFVAREDIAGTGIKSGDRVALIQRGDGRFDAVLANKYKEGSTGYTVSREHYVDPSKFEQVGKTSKPAAGSSSDPAPQAPKQVTPVKAVERPKAAEAVAPVKEKPAPTKSNLPDDMTPVGAEPVGPAPAGKKKTPKKLTPEQQANKDFANRFVSMPAKDSGMRGRLASAVGLEQDAALPVRDILRDGGVTGKKAERIADLSDRLDEILESKRQIQRDYRKTVVKGGEVDTAPARVRGRQTREEADLMAKLRSEIGSLELKGDKGERAMRALEGVIQAKNANQLFGAPVERGFTADVMGTAMYAAKNPIKMGRSITQHGNPASSAWGTVKRGWTTLPKTVTEGYKYLITNPYRTAMAPAQIAADMRRGAFRTEMTKWAYKEVKKGDLTNAQAEKISRMAGDDMEVLVNMGAGVDNGTVSLFRYRKALKQWKEFIKSGTDADHRKFMEVVDRQKTLADAISKGVVDKKYRVIAPLVNGLLPYMRNAVNMTTKGVALDLNPFTLSLIDGIRRDQRGWAANLALGIKNKTVDYTVLAALASTLVYNPSEDADDQGVPPGVSIHMGGDNYFSIRGTPIELPLATIAMTKEIVQDTNDGKDQDWQYYANMVKNSIPYVDYMDSHGNVLDSIANWGGKEGDSGYAAKNFMVSNTKSLVPFSNNNIEAALSRLDLDGDGSRSMNAKKTYDKDPRQWLANQLGNSGMGFLPFVPERSSLEDSRDAAGRVRTVNNQGAWMNKRINDQNTRTYNNTITDLVKYARQNKLGKGTQEMFNTYPDGKNNNFKSVQDKITFLDAPEKDGKKTPDNAKKLEPNEKLYDLSQQIYNGFFGDTSADLLTLDGTELRSDVAVPGKNNPGKNTNLPISIASIRNAIAQTDLPQEDWDKLNSISEAKSAIAERAKSGEIAWSQYYDALPEFSAQESAILANSPGNQRLSQLMTKLRDTGFFEPEGLGSTRSGQTYLWNSLNAMLGDKGKTPAAQWAESGSGSGFTPWGRGGGGRKGFNNIMTPAEMGTKGIRWSPVGKRQMANVKTKGYTPFKATVKLDNAIRRDRTQNYADRNI